MNQTSVIEEEDNRIFSGGKNKLCGIFFFFFWQKKYRQNDNEEFSLKLIYCNEQNRSDFNGRKKNHFHFKTFIISILVNKRL